MFSRISHGGGAAPTTITGDIASIDTSVNIAASSGWPDGTTAPFYAVIDQGLASEEKILVTTRASLTLNGLTRGVDGTTPQAHSSGAVIIHCFTATEADEANQAVVATLGKVTTKGDLLVATGSQQIGRLGVGADGTVPQADSSQASGLRYGQVTGASIAAGTITPTQLAANSVTNAKVAANTVTGGQIQAATITGANIAANTVTAANINASSLYVASGNTLTTDANGMITVTHGATFSPGRVMFSLVGDARGANVLIGYVFSLTGTQFVISFAPARGTNVGVPVTIEWVVFP